jgi:hypothetical protein
MTLQRLIIAFKPKVPVVHALYGTQGGPNPNTKACRRKVSGLVKIGLKDTLDTLEDEAECVGTLECTTREDVLLATTSLDTQ